MLSQNPEIKLCRMSSGTISRLPLCKIDNDKMRQRVNYTNASGCGISLS